MISLTERAAEKLRTLYNQYNRPEAALRVAVLGGDCAGLKYFVGLDDFQGHDDYTIHSRNFILLIDSQSAPYLWGSQIDWLEVEGDAGFVIFNPNKGRSQGGCGTNGSGCMTKGDGNTCLNKKKQSGGCSGGCSSCASSRNPEVHQITVN
ncbi:MAG: HesB/IscA family protein [bacterium]|jgi:iron-sulfur cluster assembly accessory protein